MGNFCEAFGIEKIEPPSTKRKRIIEWRKPTRQPFTPKPVAKSSPALAKPKLKGKALKKASKKPIVCFKCGKPGHKAFQCKTEQKINELFAEDAQMKAKLLFVLLQEHTDEDDNDYYSESTESEYESSPLPIINVITTTKSQKEFLLHLIGQIPDGELKKNI